MELVSRKLFHKYFAVQLKNALTLLGSNWTAAQQEKGEVAKFFRATSGISIADIQKYGIQGGEGSEINKILGGENSPIRQALKVLDPTKSELPKVDLPNLPSLPNIPLPNVPLPNIPLPQLPDINLPKIF